MYHHLFEINSRSKITITLFYVMLVSACATTTLEKAVVADPSQSVTTEGSQQDSEKATTQVEQNLPNLELDAELLEQLLVYNLASYQGDWQAAVKSAVQSANTSRDPRLARMAALTALRIKDYHQAAGVAELWVELDPLDSDANGTLLLAQVGAGLIEPALKGFSKLGADQSVDDQIKEVAGLLVRQTNQQSAIEIVEHFIQQHPDSAQVLLSSSYVAHAFDQFDQADQWLDRALLMKPNWDLAAQMKTSALRRENKKDEVLAYIKQFVERNPTSVAMRMNYAAELAREKSYQPALEIMQGVIADDQKNISALNYTAALARSLKKDSLAQEYYQRAIKLDPSNEDVRWALARYAAEEKDYLRAERHYLKVTSEGNYLGAQLQVANMRYHTRSLKDAINTLRALEPKTEAEYVNVAVTRHWLLMQAHEYEEALGYVNETLIYLPDNTELKYARALVAAELNQIQIAEEDLRYIIAQNPDHANALNALGYTLADQTDRLDEAKGFIEKALEIRPDDAHILDSLGWVLYRQKDYVQAVAYLQQAFLASQEVEIAVHLGEVLWESGQPKQAREIWKKATELDAENRLLVKTLERYDLSSEQ